MQVTCENCYTVYDLLEDKRVVTGCPYCEHINRPKKNLASSFTDDGLGMDPSKTMLTFVEGAFKEGASSIQEAIQGQIPALPFDKKLILTIIDGEEKGKKFLLSKPVIRIGRKEVDLILKDPEISRQHCVIQIYGTTTIVRDLKSANGTWVNGLIIREDFLKDKDQIRTGHSTLEFSIQSKT